MRVRSSPTKAQSQWIIMEHLGLIAFKQQTFYLLSSNPAEHACAGFCLQKETRAIVGPWLCCADNICILTEPPLSISI